MPVEGGTGAIGADGAGPALGGVLQDPLPEAKAHGRLEPASQLGVQGAKGRARRDPKHGHLVEQRHVSVGLREIGAVPAGHDVELGVVGLVLVEGGHDAAPGAHLVPLKVHLEAEKKKEWARGGEERRGGGWRGEAR